MLLCLRGRIASYSVGVFAVIYPHVVDRSSDKSDKGSSSYAGADAASAHPSRQQFDISYLHPPLTFLHPRPARVIFFALR